LTKKYGDNEVLKGVNLKIAEGEFYALMGPNGSGKTTLASIILPWLLQQFAQIYAISSSSSSITLLLVGEAYAGYDPMSGTQTTLTILISLLLFVAGLIAYSRFCWRKE